MYFSGLPNGQIVFINKLINNLYINEFEKVLVMDSENKASIRSVKEFKSERHKV